MAEYELEEYDIKTLREARQRIMVVYNYYYGAPRAKCTVRRLETILNKLDYLIGSEKEEK